MRDRGELCGVWMLMQMLTSDCEESGREQQAVADRGIVVGHEGDEALHEHWVRKAANPSLVEMGVCVGGGEGVSSQLEQSA